MQKFLHCAVCSQLLKLPRPLLALPMLRQLVGSRQPSSPEPELPSKKQSCHFGSLLSPEMPVENVPSSLSMAPVHSSSNPSTLPSPSSSIPLLQTQGTLPHRATPDSSSSTEGGST